MGGNQSYYKAKSYEKGDFDILFVLTSSGDTYQIPSDVTNKLRSYIVLGEKRQTYKII